MSITSALALGYNQNHCSIYGLSVNYPLDQTDPYTTLGFRPAMMLAGVSSQTAVNVVDRGVASDQTLPAGQAYFVRTTDSVRSLRYPDFIATAANWNRQNALMVSYENYSAGGTLANVSDVFLYLTGLTTVPQIATNYYLPGALADHLTSFGGQLTGNSGQMSSLRWLEAGATASYGTVVEPYALDTKFPMASRLVPAYFKGATAMEAYWKSVANPGEGIFIGEPLARPFLSTAHLENNTLTIKTPLLAPGTNYILAAGDSPSGPFTTVQSAISVATPSVITITQSPVDHAYYKLYASTSLANGVLNFSATAVSTSAIHWSWNSAVQGALGFRIVSATGANISGDLSAAATSWLQSGLTANASAGPYSVVAFAAGGASTSAPVSLYTLAATPGSPTVTATSASSLSFSWPSGGNAANTHFIGQLSTSPVFSSVLLGYETWNPSALFTSLNPATTFYFRVRAQNGDAVDTGYSAATSAQTTPLPGLSAPSGLTASPTTTSLLWSWVDNSSSETGFRIANPAGANVSGDLAANTTTWLQSGLTPNVRVGPYSVVAFGAGGASTSAAAAVYTLANVPGAPGITATSASSFNVGWTAGGDPAGTLFTAQISTTPAFSSVTQSTQTTALLASFSGLAASTTYYVRVRASNGDGVATAFSAFVSSRTNATPLSVMIQPSVGGSLDFATGFGTQTIIVPPGGFSVPVRFSVQTPNVLPAGGGAQGALTTPIAAQITALDALSNPVQPALGITIRLSYAGASIGAYSDNQLIVARYDPAHNAWVPLPSTPNALTKSVTAYTDHFSLFQIMGVTPSGDLSRITVGPNPLRFGLNGAQVMTFRNCPARARVRIFSPRGALIRDARADSSGIAVWDARNDSGKPIASGVYVVLVDDAGNKKTFNVAVER